MTAPPNNKGCESRPLLLRFVEPRARQNVSFQYDPVTKVNVPKGGRVPAVRCGLDLKSIPYGRPRPGED
jgi:hypothetical protein